MIKEPGVQCQGWGRLGNCHRLSRCIAILDSGRCEGAIRSKLVHGISTLALSNDQGRRNAKQGQRESRHAVTGKIRRISKEFMYLNKRPFSTMRPDPKTCGKHWIWSWNKDIQSTTRADRVLARTTWIQGKQHSTLVHQLLRNVIARHEYGSTAAYLTRRRACASPSVQFSSFCVWPRPENFRRTLCSNLLGKKAKKRKRQNAGTLQHVAGAQSKYMLSSWSHSLRTQHFW